MKSKFLLFGLMGLLALSSCSKDDDDDKKDDETEEDGTQKPEGNDSETIPLTWEKLVAENGLANKFPSIDKDIKQATASGSSLEVLVCGLEESAKSQYEEKLLADGFEKGYDIHSKNPKYIKGDSLIVTIGTKASEQNPDLIDMTLTFQEMRY